MYILGPDDKATLHMRLHREIRERGAVNGFESPYKGGILVWRGQNFVEGVNQAAGNFAGKAEGTAVEVDIRGCPAADAAEAVRCLHGNLVAEETAQRESERDAGRHFRQTEALADHTGNLQYVKGQFFIERAEKIIVHAVALFFQHADVLCILFQWIPVSRSKDAFTCHVGIECHKDAA